MASVQELIAAANHNTNAKKSPFLQLAEGFTQGQLNAMGPESGLARIKQEMDIQAMKEDRRRQDEMDAEIRQKLAADSESRVQNSLNKVTGAKSTTPQHKLKETLKQDATGRWTRAYEEVTTDPSAAAGGAHPIYNPAQIEAISSGDMKKLSAAFPDGVPDAAVKATYGGDLIANHEAERDKRRVERRSKERTDTVDKFNAHPTSKRSSQSLDAAESVRGLVTSGNPIAAASVPTYMARAAGEVGALSEADKAPFGGSHAILDRLNQAVTQQASGTLTEDNAKFLLSLADIMEKTANSNLDRNARERATQYAAASAFHKDPKEVFAMLRPNSEFAPKAVVAAPGSAALEASIRTKLGLPPKPEAE